LSLIVHYNCSIKNSIYFPVQTLISCDINQYEVIQSSVYRVDFFLFSMTVMLCYTNTVSAFESFKDYANDHKHTITFTSSGCKHIRFSNDNRVDIFNNLLKQPKYVCGRNASYRRDVLSYLIFYDCILSACTYLFDTVRMCYFYY